MSNFAEKAAQTSLLNNVAKTGSESIALNSNENNNDVTAGSESPADILKEQGLFDLDSYLSQSQDSTLNKQMIGLTEMAVKRLSAVGQQDLGVMSNGIFALIEKAIGIGKKIADILSGTVKLKSDTASKIESEKEGYEKHLKEASKYHATVMSQIGIPKATGNSVTEVSNTNCFIQNYLLFRSTATTISSSVVDIAADTTYINSSKIVSVNTNIWQGQHYYYHINVDHGIQLNCKTALRYNSLSLREQSAEAEYIAGTMVTYADVLWNQAGQVSNTPLNATEPELAASYGSMVNYAQYNMINKAALGFMVQSATGILGLEGGIICLNCKWTRSLSLITPKIYAGITDATQAVSQQEASDKGGGQYIEVDEYVGTHVPNSPKIAKINPNHLA